MKKLIILVAIVMMSQTTFASEASGKGLASTGAEIFFTTAMTSVLSEATSFSVSDAQKLEAKKILNEIQEYNQTGFISAFLAQKIAIVNSLESDLSVDDSIDVLIEASEIILSK